MIKSVLISLNKKIKKGLEKKKAGEEQRELRMQQAILQARRLARVE